MKKYWISLCLSVYAVLCVFSLDITAYAKKEETIKEGVYAQDISLGGMTEKEAEAEIKAYVESLMEIPLTLIAAEGQEVTVTPAQLGMVWVNPNIVREAIGLGKEGNIVQRYKAIEDLAHDKYVYDIELSFDSEMIATFLTENCSKYDVKAVDMTLTGSRGNFTAVEGKEGYALNVEQSVSLLEEYLVNDWERGETSVALVVDVQEPRGTEEELLQLKDILGTFTTSYKSSAPGRCLNVENGCKKINGTILYPGDEFSTYDLVSPFTKDNGYDVAGAYLKGKVIDSVGGGICQVSTTLYNAVLLSELDVTMRYNHSMIVTYVEPSMDAAISESAGKDFRFVNNLEHPVYIEGYTENKKITFTIYGVETRSADRTVEYQAEIISETPAGPEVIYTDASKPVGYVASQGAHIGYKARLWKIVKENGKEISKEKVNNSTYSMSPRSATVGIATSDPNAYNQIMAAIATGSINHVKNVAAALSSGQQISADVTEMPAEE